MKKLVLVLIGVLTFASTLVQADPATEKEVMKTIVDSNAYSMKHLKSQGDEISKDGSLEFWSSGGLLHEVANATAPDEFESISIDVKHIQVITLVPGQAAVAQYYSEGSLHPKGSPAVSNYRTRVTQVFIKEGGEWKVRAAHWSPIAGGAGTSQTAINQ